MATAVISIGSNIEDRLKHMSMALVKVAFLGRIKALADIYQTPPVGLENQPDFLNGAIALETTVAPLELLKNFMEIEAALGRVRGVKNGPRTVDLDLVFYDGLCMDTPELTVPHPRWRDRDFVVTPLIDLMEKGVFDGAEFSEVRRALEGRVRKFKPFLRV